MKNYLRYACVIVAVPAAIFLRLILLPLTGPDTPYITLFPVTVIVAIIAGMGPAILTGILSAIVEDYFIMSPLSAIGLNVEGISRMTIMILTSVSVGYVGNMLRKAKYGLEVRVKERTTELMETNEFLRLEEARLDALLQLSQKSEAALDEITGFTLERTIKLTESKIGFVGFLSEDEKVYALHSVSKDVVKECNVVGNPIHWPVDDAGIWADAVRERRTLFVNDYSKPHPRKKGIPSGHVPIEKFMIVPFFDGKKIVTIAGVGNKASDYDKSDERQVSLLLSGMWSCVQKSRSMERLERAYGELEDKVKERTAKLAASTAALQESHKDLNRAQAVAHTGSWRLNVQRNELSWSDEAYKIFGLPKGTSLTYETFLDSVYPEDRKYVDIKWREALRGKGYDIEHRIISDGEVKWVRERAELELEKDGAILGGFGTVQDITELKSYEEQIKNLAKFPAENPSPVLRISGDGMVIYSNKPGTVLLEQWGRQTEQKVPENWLKLVSKSLTSGRFIVEEIVCGERIFSFIIAPVIGENYVNLYGRDITGLKKAEEALREAKDELEVKVAERTVDLAGAISSLQEEIRERVKAEKSVKAERQRLYDVLETLPVCVVLLTEDYHVSFANRFFKERFGASYGKKCYEYLCERKEPCEVCETYKVIKTDKPQHWEWLGPDGRNYDIYDYPFTDADGSKLVMKMGIDITEQVKAENKILENQRALRALAAELQIVEEGERRRIAQDLHDSIGQILAFSGRELKGLQKTVPETAAKTLQEVANQLDIAVEQTRTLSFDLSPSMLYDLGLEVAIEDLVDRISEKRKIKCRFENCEPAKPLAKDVEVLLYRSVRELLINAVKHANASFLKVFLSRSDSEIHIEVEDNGRGFDTSILDDSSKKTKGFGIFSIRERLNHIGGHLRIESAEGKGTRVVLTAPLDVGEEE